MKVVFLALALAFVANGALIKKGYIPTEFQPLSQELIDFVNMNAHSTWKAGRNFEDVSVQYVKGLCGVIEDPNGPRLKGIFQFQFIHLSVVNTAYQHLACQVVISCNVNCTSKE